MSSAGHYADFSENYQAGRRDKVEEGAQKSSDEEERDPTMGYLTTYTDKVPPLVDPVKVVTFFYTLLNSNIPSSTLHDCLEQAARCDFRDSVVTANPIAAEQANNLLEQFLLIPRGRMQERDRRIWEYDTRLLPPPSKDEDDQ